MTTKSFIAKTAAVAIFTMAAFTGAMTVASPAEAGPKKKFGVSIVIGGGHGFYGAYGPHYAGYSHHGSCRWLYRRAVKTGSPYWWKRFHNCRHGFGW
jgi:hypothetical protein